jgi:hypothetical protein
VKPRRGRAVVAALGLVPLLVMGCGSAPPRSAGPVAGAGQQAVPLDTSAVGTGESYSVLQMGGPAASEENFWQLFVRPAGATQWRLATPLGVADNGGLVVAATGGSSLLAGFRPSQDLTFSPLATTSDDGTTWSAVAPLPAGLANEPGAVAAGAAGRLLALTTAGTILASDGTQRRWTALTSERELAASPAGRGCGVTSLTAVAFGANGGPLVAGSCRRTGEAGLFSQDGGRWRLAGPPLGSSGTGGSAVLALATAGTGTGASSTVASGAASKDAVANGTGANGTGAHGTGAHGTGAHGTGAHGPAATTLIRTGSAASGRLVVAWQSDTGTWSLSAPLITGSARVLSASLWPGGAIGVVFSAARAAVLTGPGAQWEPVSDMPAGTATLAVEPGGQVEALAASGGTFRAWTFASGTWHLAQTIRVPVPYGSSS